MKKLVIESENAPKAIGPYSQGIVSGGLCFLSGQIPLDPATGTIVEGGIQRQTEQVLENIAAVLAAAGGNFSNVVKCTIYLTDLANFSVVNEIYGRCFDDCPPARSTIEVKGLPRGAMVEIEVIACMD